MTTHEKMRELFNLPTEELSAKLAYADEDEDKNAYVARRLRMMFEYDDLDPGARYCLTNHKNCKYLESDFDSYDYGANENYGLCQCEGDCPYGVSRKDITRQEIFKFLSYED